MEFAISIFVFALYLSPLVIGAFFLGAGIITLCRELKLLEKPRGVYETSSTQNLNRTNRAIGLIKGTACLVFCCASWVFFLLLYVIF